MADIVKLIYKGDEMAQGGGGGVSGQMHVTELNILGTVDGNPGDTTSISYTAPRAGFIDYRWSEKVFNGKVVNKIHVSGNSGYNLMRDGDYIDDNQDFGSGVRFTKYHENFIPVAEGETITITLSINTPGDWSQVDPGGSSIKIFNFYYFD